MSAADAGRYARQELFWGADTQRLIAGGALLIAGLGGLGCTVAQIMARAGVGRLHLVDDGAVALPDLQRQSLYGECDLGRRKAQVARERLSCLNSGIELIAHDLRIDDAFAPPDDIRGAADCLDNFASRFALYRSLPVGTFLVHGGVQGDQGQLITLVQGASGSLEGIFAGSRQPEGTVPVTPDSVFVIAGLMANELLANLAGRPKLLDRFLVVDLAGLSLCCLEVES
jgi:molybdopterin-synthase adenylyltransferase